MKKCVKQWFFYKILFWGFCKQTKESRNPLCPFSARHSIPIYSRAYFSSSEERISIYNLYQFINFKSNSQLYLLPSEERIYNLQFISVYINLLGCKRLRKILDETKCWCSGEITNWWQIANPICSFPTEGLNFTNFFGYFLQFCNKGVFSTLTTKVPFCRCCFHFLMSLFTS